MKQPRFTITITNFHWSCGDGCCSDSGYKLYVEDHKPEVKGYSCVTENRDWDMNRCENRLLEYALEKIQDKLGYSPVKNVDYKVVEDDEYSDERGLLGL